MACGVYVKRARLCMSTHTHMEVYQMEHTAEIDAAMSDLWTVDHLEVGDAARHNAEVLCRLMEQAYTHGWNNALNWVDAPPPAEGRD